MSTDKRLDVKLSLVITDDDKPFSSAIITWDDVPYDGVLEIEKNMLVFLDKMHQFGVSLLGTDTPAK